MIMEELKTGEYPFPAYPREEGNWFEKSFDAVEILFVKNKFKLERSLTEENRVELFNKLVIFLINLYNNIFRYAVCLKTDACLDRKQMSNTRRVQCVLRMTCALCRTEDNVKSLFTRRFKLVEFAQASTIRRALTR